MKSKFIIGLGLLGFISIGMANTRIFKDVAININDNGGAVNSRYSISINKVITKANSNKNILNLPTTSSTIQEIGDSIWSFTTGQLPVTEDSCLRIPTCDKNDDYCYNHCLIAGPDVVAFDEKANKLYFSVGTAAIGTGGGPAFLFVANINKKEIKLLHEEWDQELGSLSPSGRYLVIYGNSTMQLYDTQNYHRSTLNKSEDSYDKNHNIRHGLYVKKWLSNTQFIYVDIARYFVRPIPENGEPFFSSKEVTYDITSRKILSERKMTEKEANDYEKSLGPGELNSISRATDLL